MRDRWGCGPAGSSEWQAVASDTRSARRSRSASSSSTASEQRQSGSNAGPPDAAGQDSTGEERAAPPPDGRVRPRGGCDAAGRRGLAAKTTPPLAPSAAPRRRHAPASAPAAAGVVATTAAAAAAAPAAAALLGLHHAHAHHHHHHHNHPLHTPGPGPAHAAPAAGCCALTAAHNIGRPHPAALLPASMLVACAGCDKPILDKFLLNVLERTWHAECVRCFDCHGNLTDKCFSREGKLFCRNDFYRRYGTKCGGCAQGISPQDLVRKARDKVFHLNCFTCMVCRKQLSTGEELYVLDDNKFICKDDYMSGKTHQDSLLGSGSEDEDEECEPGVGGGSALKGGAGAAGAGGGAAGAHGGPGAAGAPPPHTPLQPPPEANNNDMVGPLVGGAPPGPLVPPADVKPGQDDSEDQGSLDGDPETRDSQTENKSPDDGNSGSKRRGPRTTIKAKQLEILKTAFSQTPKPTRHIREQLAKETGLPMRVIQVWFQNKRSKERRLKQLTSMGRGPFFGSSRKMRGFPMNLSPGAGLDDPPPGFPYFAADGKFEFGYGGPAGFHHEFFPGHHPHQPQPLPFGGPGGPMEQGGPGPGLPLAAEFAGLTAEPPPGFLPQPPPPADQILAQQRASPEFISSQGGFSETQQMQSEVVW